MTDVSPTYRLSAALIAVLFVLGWGVPLAQAACMSSGSMRAGHCGGTETHQHCDGDMGPSAACLMPLLNQGAHTERGPSVDPLMMGGGDQPVRSSDAIRKRTGTSLVSTGPALRQDHRLYAHVGAWLE